jgi:hypothetical protein
MKIGDSFGAKLVSPNVVEVKQLREGSTQFEVFSITVDHKRII